MSITDFLLARIAEDEAMARAAIDPAGMSSSKDGRWVFVEYPYEGFWPVNADSEPSMWEDIEWVAHAERHDPARVLAECAAKGAIVAAHEAYAQEAIESTGIAFVGARVGQQATGDILRTLAAVYANHPGYRAEWAIHQGGWRG